MVEGDIEAVLTAIDSLYQSSPAKLPQFTARQIADEAHIDPADAVKALFQLKESVGLNFHRAGGGHPDHSIVICPFKEADG